MNREEKAAVIEEVAGQISAAQAVFAVDYRGITVAQVAELRTRLRDSNTRLRVVKNSLSERAAEKAGAAELKSLLVGPTALALVEGDAAAAAKTLSDTNRQLRLLDFKGGYMDGALLSAADVQSIARLPSREVLHAQLVGTIASPLSGLVRTLNALIAGLAVALGQVAEKGLVGGTASVSAAADESPAVADESPAVADESPADADESPAVAEESPAVADDSPADTDESPAVADESPAVAEESPTDADGSQADPQDAAAGEARAEVAEAPAATENPDPEVAPATSNGGEAATAS